ncbi:MAG: DHHA1 domain-containing protein, partial [Hyphomicrobiales bacterium]
QVGNILFCSISFNNLPDKDLKGIVDKFKIDIGSGVVAVSNTSSSGSASLVVGVTNDLAGKVNAIDLVKLGAAAMGGKGGGGRPDMAQAGGPEGAKAAEAIAAIKAAL